MAVAEYRLCFTKGSSVRFLSHLDMAKTMERALRRADIPLAYSEGFHPHPKMSFGPALAVGISSLEEYLDVETVADIPAEELQERLNRSLPEGLRILAAKRCLKRPKPLNAVINRAVYRLTLETEPSRRPAVMEILEHCMSSDRLEVTRVNKNGQKVVNIRPWLHNLKTEAFDEAGLQVSVTGEIGSNGNLRPDDILQLLPFPVKVRNIVRAEMWHEEHGIVVKPLDLC